MKLKFWRPKVNIEQWGTERAVLSLLGPADRAWVTLRYQQAAAYIHPEDVVLDAATGSGFGAEILAARAKTVIGVDFNPEAIEYARQKHQRRNIRFLKADVLHLPFPENHFNLAIGIETLEHLREYEDYLLEMKRVVKSGGGIVLSTPRKKSEVPQTPFHIMEFSYHEFKKVLGRFFSLKKIIGLKRLAEPLVADITEENYQEFDIYLGVCLNVKE